MSTALEVRVERNLTPPLKTTPTRRQPKPGKYHSVHAYRDRWFRPSGPPRQQLRAAYGNDRERYILSYQQTDEDVIFFREIGMQAFIRMERKLLRRMRLDPYYISGMRAIESLGASLGDDVLNPDRTNIILLSLDFEYNDSDAKSVTEIGFAKIDKKQLLCQENTVIAASNFTLRNKGNGERQFVFGSSTRLSSELCQRTVLDLITQLSHDDPHSEIILVSQSVVSEIRILDDIGLPLEDLPIAGIIDTCHFAKDVLGRGRSLRSLLTTLTIPFRTKLLHCAGNDAHLTLQALLALIQARYGDKFGRLERFSRQEVPLRLCCREGKVDVDWAENLDLDACLTLFPD